MPEPEFKRADAVFALGSIGIWSLAFWGWVISTIVQLHMGGYP